MDLLKSLYRIRRKSDLKNIKKMDLFFKNPSKKFKSIHVAGTNGKGSVATKVAAGLILSGYRVGLFTSPHLFAFEERISINGENIKKEEAEKFLKEIFKAEGFLKIKNGFFEITTLLAFCYFCKKDVDIAVIEVGIGGREDSTNIINPLLAIITSISLDHTRTLGDSLEKIAFQKAGIIKEKVPLVIGPTADLQVIRKMAKEKKSVLVKAKKRNGFFDLQNKEIAREALKYLKKNFVIEDEVIEKAILKRPKCRFEIFLKENFPRAVILDVAHNPDGFKNLFRSAKKCFPKNPIRVVFGFSKGKDVKESVRIISSNSSFVHLVDTFHEKLLKKSTLYRHFRKEGNKKVSFEKNIKSSVEKAIKLAKERGEIVIVCGSFFIMKEALAVLNRY
jgi:dihydrofolate synthase/folylpolyglutamate synthase